MGENDFSLVGWESIAVDISVGSELKGHIIIVTVGPLIIEFPVPAKTMSVYRGTRGSRRAVGGPIKVLQRTVECLWTIRITSANFSAEISVRSHQKLVFFMIYENKSGSKYRSQYWI